MTIELYEDWMKPQVAKLFSMQYGVSENDFSTLIDNFYELPFQKNKCIRIVAREGERIIAFQSFFYWPYTFKDKTFNSYQSGNSLVHEDYRGKGIFQSLLNYLDNHKKEFKIDFLVGFPIDVSIGSLLRNKWLNLFNLQWYVKFNALFSFFLPLNLRKIQHLFPNQDANRENKTETIKIEHSSAFGQWRNTHYTSANYFSFRYTEGKDEIVLKLKTNIRKKVIKELIIGDIITTSQNHPFLNNAIEDFLKTAKKIKCISLVSIALNEKLNSSTLNVLKTHGFKKINKQIYFCVKPFSDIPTILNPENWEVYRGDIDTW